jgi:hypothetical protein
VTFLIGTPHAKGSGYFLNDNTASGGEKVEDDVRTCPHCQAVILMRKWRAYGGFCRQCNAPVCGLCGERMEMFGCEPFLKILEAQFGRDSRIRSVMEPVALPQSIVYGPMGKAR